MGGGEAEAEGDGACGVDEGGGWGDEGGDGVSGVVEERDGGTGGGFEAEDGAVVACGAGFAGGLALDEVEVGVRVVVGGVGGDEGTCGVAGAATNP